MHSHSSSLSPAPVNASPAFLAFKRGSYGELINGNTNLIPKQVHDLVARVCRQIGFDTGIESINKKGGFIASNVDIYGYDLERGLVALQFRQSWKRKEGYWLSQKKVYALAGMDEGDQLFCHAIPTSFQRIRDIADATPLDVVRWAESKIFRVPVERLHTIIRQGDIALVPVRSIPRDAKIIDVKSLTLRGSHQVLIDGIAYKDDDRIWVDGVVEIDHTPGQHRAIDAEGRFEIVQGVRREDFDFVDANTVD